MPLLLVIIKYAGFPWSISLTSCLNTYFSSIYYQPCLPCFLLTKLDMKIHIQAQSLQAPWWIVKYSYILLYYYSYLKALMYWDLNPSEVENYIQKREGKSDKNENMHWCLSKLIFIPTESNLMSRDWELFYHKIQHIKYYNSPFEMS